jgi:signal transduction histidine kinase
MYQDEIVMTEPQTASEIGERFRLLGWSLALALLAELGISIFCWFITSMSIIVVTVGVPLTLLGSVTMREFANLHRHWAGRMLGTEIGKPYMPFPEKAGWLIRLLTILRDPATWRDWIWILVNAVVGFALTLLSAVLFLASIFYLIYPFLYSVTPQNVFGNPFGFYHIHDVAGAFVVVPLGLVYAVLWWTTQKPLLRAHANIAKWLLAPTEQAALRARVTQLAESRADTVDTQAAELRRIERDLHDGAQARLVSLGMSLGLAEEMMASNPEAARQLLTEARESTSSALSELRDLVRGIHPPVLADRGLDGAVRALALANPVPTDVVVDIPGRLPAPVESAAYFAVAESLTNAIKHGSAGKILVQVGYAPGILTMRVSDDGRGGADPAKGTGLRGIERRLSAFDGRLTVDSPVGGPTDVRMTLPCELLSQKTSPSFGTD